MIHRFLAVCSCLVICGERNGRATFWLPSLECLPRIAAPLEGPGLGCASLQGAVAISKPLMSRTRSMPSSLTWHPKEPSLLIGWADGETSTAPFMAERFEDSAQCVNLLYHGERLHNTGAGFLVDLFCCGRPDGLCAHARRGS